MAFYKYEIENRRYIGNKYKLMPWIKRLIHENTSGNSFFDVFAGTGSVTFSELDAFDSFILNDFLYSNEIVFNAFFSNDEFNEKKLQNIVDDFNKIKDRSIDDEYFEKNYGGKYFSNQDSIIIGEIRERINKSYNLSKREKSILISSLLYSVDHIANTVGHYDAYRKNVHLENRFHFDLIKPLFTKNKKISIYREDANELVRKVYADVVFLDPPYNSRQYSRFYHVLENITKWNKPELFGVAMKPKTENMSNYSRVSAPEAFDDLVSNIHGKYIVVTYNNTYEGAKSSSSRNKITHNQILESLNKVGKTKVFNKPYKFFNSGKTELKNHEEFLFITKIK